MKPATGKALTGILYTLLWLLAFAIMFRSFFLSGGDQIVGDVADGQLIQSIHEHWFRVFSGLEEWRNLNIFYPVNDTLGYSDTFFLQGIPYSALRFMGVDMFIAFQLVQMLLASVGFWGMLVWLRKCRGIHPALAGWGALLFVMASPFYLNIRNSHIQLLAIWLLPTILVFFEGTLTRLRDPDNSPNWNFLFFSTLFGGLVYSTFYAAFFLFLGLTIALVSAFFIYGTRKTISFLWPSKAGWRSLFPGLIVFMLWMGLFIWTYLPVRQEMGGRSLSEALDSVPLLWNIFNHSDYNLVWGYLNKMIWSYPDQHRWSFELCLPVVTLLVACIVAVLVIRKRREWKLARPDLLLSGYVLLVSLLLTVRIGPVSLWALPYYIMPGADAIRVVPRYNLALLIPVIFLICFFLQTAWNKLSIRTKIVPVLLVLLITLEQVQLVEHSNISRQERATIVDLAEPVPVDADAFFAVGKPMWGWHRDAPHNSAMHLSQVWNLPTINGRSGFLAKDWPMYEMNPDIAFSNLHKWANEKSLTGSIYMYDLDSGKWVRNINFSFRENGFSVNEDLMSLPLDAFRKIAAGGWSDQEFWGVWSNADVAKLQFPKMDFISGEANLVLDLSAYLHALHPRVSVQIIINGKVVGREEFTTEFPRKKLTIPVSIDGRKGWSLKFHIDSPVSPKSLGLHDDPRLLGIALHSLQIHK